VASSRILIRDLAAAPEVCLEAAPLMPALTSPRRWM